MARLAVPESERRRDDASEVEAGPAIVATPRSPAKSRHVVRRVVGWFDPAALLVPISLIGIWQAIIGWELIDTQYLPAPLEVLRTIRTWVFGSEGGHGLYDGTWLEHALASSQRVLYGFLVGAMAGLLMGFLIGWSRLGARLFDPLFQILRPIPITAWLPFVVVFLGTQGKSAVALISIGAFFPVLLNTVHGLRHVDGLLIRAAQMLGCRSKLRLLVRVGIPAALPAIFTGLRLGVGLAWVLVIVAEMIAVKSGFGYVMWDAYFFLRMDMIVAAMLSVGIMGYVFDRLVLAAERYACAWTT